MTNKYFLYARVSTGTQQTGLEAQIRALKEYCRMRGIDDYVIYQDENQSGTKSSRPALDQMMKAIRNGEARGVIVYSFSRYARSVTHLLSALSEFKKLEVRFISMTESIDTDTPLGIALFTILGAVAQLERDLIADGIKNREALRRLPLNAEKRPESESPKRRDCRVRWALGDGTFLRMSLLSPRALVFDDSTSRSPALN